MLKVGPYIHANFDRTYEWGKVFKGKNSSNKTQSQLILKSDAWLYALCTGDCPANCTGYAGESTDWGFINKSINPLRFDKKVPDPSLNVICKGIRSYCINVKSTFVYYVYNHIKNIRL